ncbi:hypothetical protein BFG57_00520 [Bacillus solimangrovi]|uniref:Uncharacterized protein n=1 Tax=Bacillus solimangrovi TaxID=1305675 RepID=A0A1E5LHV8_9BACI|nr:hypothetical protein BFG57_00520 [Bacillus solimangrovi]
MVKERYKIDGFLVFYIIVAAQVGVGVLGFQRVIMSKAGYDGWITIILTGILFHLAIYIIYSILNRYKTDVIEIQRFIFGKWIGGFINLIIAFYFLYNSVTVLTTFIEVIQVWMFPTLSSWVLGFLFCSLIYYIVSGGFRVVTGMCFLGFFITIPLILFLLFPLEYSDFVPLLPIIQKPIGSIVGAISDSMISFMGIELLLIFYPFIKNPEKSQKSAQFGSLFTTVLYLLIIIITFGFFSEDQLERTIWATLSMFKVAEFSFIERLEYVTVTVWVFVVVPTMILYLWASSRIIKRTTNFSQRKVIICLLLIVLISIVFINSRIEINYLNQAVNYVSFYLIFAYIPILFILSKLFYRKYRRTMK